MADRRAALARARNGSPTDAEKELDGRIAELAKSSPLRAHRRPHCALIDRPFAGYAHGPMRAPSMPSTLACALLAALVTPLTARADDQPIDLVYRSFEGCPSERQFIEMVVGARPKPGRVRAGAWPEVPDHDEGAGADTWESWRSRRAWRRLHAKSPARTAARSCPRLRSSRPRDRSGGVDRARAAQTRRRTAEA